MKKKILIIEDDAPLSYLLEKILQPKFDVTVKSDPLSAMFWLSHGNLPDVILSDFHLPGISGLDFIQNLQRSGAYSQIPLVMLSGMTDKKLIDECMTAGASAFVLKPFDPPYLEEVIIGAIKKSEIYA